MEVRPIQIIEVFEAGFVVTMFANYTGLTRIQMMLVVFPASVISFAIILYALASMFPEIIYERRTTGAAMCVFAMTVIAITHIHPVSF